MRETAETAEVPSSNEVSGSALWALVDEFVRFMVPRWARGGNLDQKRNWISEPVSRECTSAVLYRTKRLRALLGCLHCWSNVSLAESGPVPRGVPRCRHDGFLRSSQIRNMMGASYLSSRLERPATSPNAQQYGVGLGNNAKSGMAHLVPIQQFMLFTTAYISKRPYWQHVAHGVNNNKVFTNRCCWSGIR